MPRSRKARSASAKGRPAVAAAPPLPAVPARAALLCSVAVALVVLLVYLRTLIPTVVDQDSGELVAAAHTLGVAHPTGYPLWTLLGRFFDLLPLGHTSAYRVALASAVPAAAAAGVVCWLTIVASGALLPGILAGLAFGLWFPTWSQAVLAEVYGISGLLFSLFLVALWKFSRARPVPALYRLALAGGAVAMHHRTAFLAVAPALAVSFWLTARRRPKPWIIGVLLFFAPFLLYLYLPIAASAHPAVNWGDPSTLDRFYAHAMGSQYTHFAFNNSFGEAMAQAAKLLGESLAGGIGRPPMPTAFASPEPVLAGMPALRLLLSLLLVLVGLPLIAAGWWRWFRRQRPEALAVAAGCLVLCVWVLEWGETTDLKVFLLPLGVVLAMCGGLGLAEVRARLSGLRGHAAVAALGALVAVVLFGANLSRSDRHNEWLYRDEWRAALLQMEQNAIFISDGDVPSFVTMYLQNVEGLRQDITLIRTAGMPHRWYVNQIRDPELRRVADEGWKQLTLAMQIRASAQPEFHVGTALLAGMLAEHYRNRRPVYALHPPHPGMPQIEGPPFYLGLTEDLVRVTFRPPDMLRARPPGHPLVRLADGPPVNFALDSGEAGAGALISFRARWPADAPFGWFGVLLAPEGADPGAFQARCDREVRVRQGYPLLHGMSPDQLTGAAAWEQRGGYLVPSNAPPGRYDVFLSYCASYPPTFRSWVPAGTFRILPRPLPTDGP